jgi:drug/metabolite transporter (DMT)-like permease
MADAAPPPASGEKDHQHYARESDPLLISKVENDETEDESCSFSSDEQEGILGSTFESISHGMEHMSQSFAFGMDHMMEVVVDATDIVKEAVVDAADNVKEAVVEEVTEIADTLMDELHEADDGGNFYLEMALTRNFSILPTDMEHAVEVANTITITTTEPDETATDMETLETVKEESEVPPHAALTTPISAYILLATAVLSLSAIGPLLQAQNNVSSTMKICWRQLATSFLLFPFAVVSVKREGCPIMTWTQWFTFMIAAACYTTMGVGFSLALDYTSVGNAVILANSQSLMLLAGKMLVGQRVSTLEGTGALIAFAGAIFCSVDSSQAAPDSAATGVGGGGKTIYGDGMAILSALGGVGYLVFAKQTRSHMSLYVFMYLNMLMGSIMTLLFMTLILKEPVTWDRHVSTGVFGWLNIEPDRLPLEIVMVLVCNFFGSVGYIRAMQFFDNLVICVAALMEPVVAESLAFMLGVGFLPGWLGWLGNALVLTGTFAVVYQPQNGDKLASHSE